MVGGLLRRTVIFVDSAGSIDNSAGHQQQSWAYLLGDDVRVA